MLLFALVALIALGYMASEIWIPRADSREVTVRIPEGASFDEIVSILDEVELIRSRTTFQLLATTTGADAKIKPGTYRFPRGISAAGLLESLVAGRSTVRRKVTIPEGSTMRRIASIAAGQAGIDSAAFMELATDRAFLRTIGVDATSAEGYLMPDTYFLYWGDTPETLLRKMADLHSRFFNEEMKRRAAAVGLTPDQVIVLASIVEGEARVADERPMVAGVYLNRLRRGMRLQADPTLQYVLPDGPRRLLKADLEMDSPYNSYRYSGLPPTPINNPGRASIEAVLAPDRHDYLYFVARADGSGRHEFSRNGIEHAEAVRDYRARVARQRASSE